MPIDNGFLILEKGVMTIRKSITMGMARMAMTLRPVE